MRGRKRQIENHTKRFTDSELFDLLKAGVLITASFIAPNVLKAVRWDTSGKSSGAYYPSTVNRTITKLLRRGYVDVKETSEGYIVILSNKGKCEVLQYDIDTMSIAKVDPWDGKWRMVFFDIEEGEKKVREMFRGRLKALGFYQMQKSVYVHPFPCAKQIAYLREVYGIPHSVKLAVLEWLENDDDLRKIFHLS